VYRSLPLAFHLFSSSRHSRSSFFLRLWVWSSLLYEEASSATLTVEYFSLHNHFHVLPRIAGVFAARAPYGGPLRRRHFLPYCRFCHHPRPPLSSVSRVTNSPPEPPDLSDLIRLCVPHPLAFLVHGPPSLHCASVPGPSPALMPCFLVAPDRPVSLVFLLTSWCGIIRPARHRPSSRFRNSCRPRCRGIPFHSKVPFCARFTIFLPSIRSGF